MSTEHNIQEQVLEKIRSGAISKRPRVYFIMQLLLIVALSIITLFFSVFVISFIVFSIHESGEQFLLGFGKQGMFTLLKLFPWSMLLLVVVLLVLFESLVRHFTFGYRVPLLRIFAYVAGGALCGGLLLTLTPLHTFLLNRADHDTLPLLGELYEQVHDSHKTQGVFRGSVISLAASLFVIAHNDMDQDADDGTWIIIPPITFDMDTISLGDKVYVAGIGSQGIVHAYGVQKFNK